jgi:alkylation response protein AidB-like acyl-CoA dehydrogenase
MESRFDDDQLALRDAVRSFCGRHASLSELAAREGHAADPAAWRGLAELGVLGMLVAPDGVGDAISGDDPDSGGIGIGIGIGIVEAAIVFEELGAHLVNGPALWSVISAPSIAGVDTGAVRVAGVEVDAGSAGPFVVAHAGECDVLVVLRDDRVEACDRSELPEPAHSEPLDPLTPTAVFSSLPPGRRIGDRHTADQLRLHGKILSASALVGVAQGALDVAASYALEREQFGVPIGSFQAVKHLLADMYVRVELARSAASAAAAASAGAPSRDAVRAGSIAKLLAGEAAIDNGRAAVQLLGGMGFTWDMLPHYFLKRAWVLENMFGTAASHAQRISTALEAEVRGR